VSDYALGYDANEERLWRMRLDEAEAFETDWRYAESEHNNEDITMKTSQAFPSKYLKAADLNGKAHLVKISEVVQEEVGQNKDLKLVAYFHGKQKGMVLNKTNADTIASKHGDETDNWDGAEIELYPGTATFQGQVVPSLKVRLPVPNAAPGDEEIPF
jgi:hypothetical protein